MNSKTSLERNRKKIRKKDPTLLVTIQLEARSDKVVEGHLMALLNSVIRFLIY